jgi:type VI secretion system protein VasG
MPSEAWNAASTAPHQASRRRRVLAPLPIDREAKDPAVDVNLKSLISKLGRTSRRALESAAGLCVTRTNYNIELEHWFLKLNEEPNGDFAKVFRQYEVDPDRVARGLTHVLDRMKTGNARTPSMSPAIIDVLKGAWLLSTVDLGLGRIRSGALLLASLSDAQMAGQLRDACRDFERISVVDLKNEFHAIVSGSAEDSEMVASPDAGGAVASPAEPGARVGSKTPALDQFCIDLTESARSGKLDPILGRDAEIRQIVDILTRRRQNNPILTGEAGVGKTAVVEGFAQRIVQGDVPDVLKNVSLRALDLGLLQAGAGVKGEFENRLKSVIEEVKSSPTPVILFIDEAHTMIGAGGQQGQGDAANLLKPALARGELRTIAATTWAEYKKYFEKDAALARRFQVVKVEEPSEEVAIAMMRGVTPVLQKHHNVTILSDAVESSVKLSARYITGRQLPDKSVSLLDTACARVAISQAATPPAVEDAHRRITLLEGERRILQAEQATGFDHADAIAAIDSKLAETKASLAALENRWKTERELARKIADLRGKLYAFAGIGGDEAAPASIGRTPDAQSPPPKAAAAFAEPAAPRLDQADAAELRKELDRLRAELAKVQGESPLLHTEVDSQTIAEVISGWTGIPIGRMMADQIQTILNLKNLLAERVIGQDHALEAITRRIQTSRAGMDDPSKPIGVFLLAGPSGVGKTETAVVLADLIYGGERNMVTINMSEYQEAHTVSSLKGAPPGYVGYGEGGVLTEAVRRKPYSVVLLDEIEKAHPDVWELFFQVFDKGRLEDGEGREIDFKNTIILCTTNVATDAIMSLCADPDNLPDLDALASAVKPDLDKVFPLALLGRMVVTPYYPISDSVMKKIIKLKLAKIVRRVRENHGIPLTYAEALVDEVAGRCKEVQSGARNVDNILTNTMLPEMSRELLSCMAEGRQIGAIHVDVGADGSFQYKFG